MSPCGKGGGGQVEVTGAGGERVCGKWPQGSRGQLVRLHTVLPSTQTHTQGLKMELSSKLHCPVGTSSFESGKDTLWVGFFPGCRPLFQPGLGSGRTQRTLPQTFHLQVKPLSSFILHPSCFLLSVISDLVSLPSGVSQNPFPRTRFSVASGPMHMLFPVLPPLRRSSILLSSRFSPRSPPPGSSF